MECFRTRIAEATMLYSVQKFSVVYSLKQISAKVVYISLVLLQKVDADKNSIPIDTDFDPRSNKNSI